VDGTEFPVEMSVSPIGDANGNQVAIIRNVTERKRAEPAIVAAGEDTERATPGKSRFLATVSHDLRQPVQTLALLNGILRRTVSEPDAIEALDQQEQAIGAMSQLLNALLDISKLEAGVVKPEQTDFAVAVVFNELYREFASLAANKGLTLRAKECVGCVRSDPMLVGQILRNLVGNAIKYTRTGGIELRCLHEQARVRIEVLDTGVGILAEHLGYIFDEFYQVEVASKECRNGVGLGLSIVQRLVRLLNLRLDVRSEVGKGSVFSLELPAGSAQAASPCRDAQRRAAPGPRIDRLRVLLVEDDFAVREATGMLLNVEGYQVSAVCSLEEALQCARRKDGVDLLVTDYHLSDGVKGTQIIAALRAILGASLKAVLVTGDTSTAIKELPREPNLRVISKPVTADALLALLRELLAA
jgi:CheY-like chemotaxis protein